MSLAFWGDGKPFIAPDVSTLGMDYWGDGAPFVVLDAAVPPGPIIEFAAAGSLSLGGTPSVLDTLPPIIAGGFAGAGNLSLGGNEASYDTITPGISEFVATGGLSLSGTCELTSTIPPTSQFTAAGFLRLSGTCQVATINPAPSLVSDFVASGFLSLICTCQVDLLTPGVNAFVAAGFLRAGGFMLSQMEVTYPASLVSAFVAAGGLEITGESLMDSQRPPVTALIANTGLGAPVLLISSNCSVAFLSPPVARFKAVGGVLIVNPEAVLAEFFDTWTLSGQAYEPSYFSGFNFNSYAVHQGKAYAAGQDGIYLLEGSDDNGEPIHTGVRLGPHNFGTDRQKRLRSLRLGDCGDAVKVRVRAGEDKGYFDVDRGRVTVSRDLQDRQFALDISDFEQLSQIEIVPLVLFRR